MVLLLTLNPIVKRYGIAHHVSIGEGYFDPPGGAIQLVMR
jgi:hypothetical protein